MSGSTAGRFAVAAGTGGAAYAVLALLPWTRSLAIGLSLAVVLSCVVFLAAVVTRRRDERVTWLVMTAGVAVIVGVRILASSLGVPHLAPAVPLDVYVEHPWVMAAGLVGYALVHLALVRLLHRSVGGLAPGSWLEGVLVLLGLLAVAVTLVLDQVAPDGVGEVGALALVGRPVASLLLVVVGVHACLLRGRPRDPRLDLLAVGTMGLFACDALAFAFTTELLDPNGTLTGLVGALRLASVALFTAAALAPRPAPVQREQAALTQLVTTLVILVSAGGLLVADHVRGLPDLAFLLALAVLLIAGARLMGLRDEVVALVGAQRLALTDDLTGLANRRALHAAMGAALEPTSAGVHLLLVDLDKFKDVNDRYGHAVGDDVLQAHAVRLLNLAEDGMTVARLGGDEFAVLASGGDDAAAVALADQVRAALSAPVRVGGLELLLGASVGVARGVPGSPAEELLRRADSAMYRAKGAGGGVQCFEEAHDDAARSRALLVDDLRAALEPDPARQLGRIVAHYQPQVAADGAVTGVEALVRWEHPRLGLLPPAAFVGLAEEQGLVVALTERVLRQAVQQGGAWHADGHRLRVAVNISSQCLDSSSLLDVVDDLLASRVLPAELLVLEVTETGLVSEARHGLEVAAAIIDRGVGLSIDDYGTGYSSLAHLVHLPARELKLDRAFTALLLEDQRTETIVRATVDLAHELGMRLVAEGVEDEVTHDALVAIGCDETQGYWHCRPLPADQLTTWLAARGAQSAGSGPASSATASPA